MPNDSDNLQASLEKMVQMPLPFSQDILTVNRTGTNSVGESYSPQHDIINCVPGAFVGMCHMVENIEKDIAIQKLGITPDEMRKAIDAMRRLLSRQTASCKTFGEALAMSGLGECTWEARTWALKNFAQVMLHMWHQSVMIRVTDMKQYKDDPVHAAADMSLRSLGQGL